ncbi:MAG: AMP-binding protein, partial [Candidatus Kapaibacterium sp.]
QPPGKQKIFAFAIGIGKRMVDERHTGSVSLSTRLLYKVADTLVFSKIRSLTGGRLRFFVSGGGALAYDVKEFFEMLGMVILEGYGLTESSPVLTVTRPHDNEIGTVGKPIIDVEIRLADDGEILARGPNIMRGYWKNEEATAKAIDGDGWLHTGDIGTYTGRGNLKITDRKKNLFVSSGGKNIAPQVVENVLLQSKYVDQVLLIGDNREY